MGVVLACLFERRLAALGLEELPVGQEVAGGCGQKQFWAMLEGEARR